MPLLSYLKLKCVTETLVIFERPEQRVMPGRYV